MSLDPFWQQAFAAALPPAREYRTTAFGPHPSTKAVLALTCSLGRLVRAFHKTENSLAVIKERLQ